MSKGGKRLGAGRPRGSVNRNSKLVKELLDSLAVEPIVGMAYIASNNKEYLGISEDVPIGIRAQMYRELAQYVFYKLKAIEVTIDDTLMSHEERLERLK